MKRTPLVLMALLLLTCPFSVHAGDVIKIGAVFPLTGESVQIYEKDEVPELRGVRLAVEELNAKGGLLGRSIRLVVYDNKSTSLGSRDAAERAVKEGSVVVFGAAWSSHSIAMAPVLQKARVPMVSPISTSPEVTEAGDYIFRACFIDPFQGDILASFATYDLKARTAVITINTSETYCVSLAECFRNRFIRLGGHVLWEGEYLREATDFKDITEKIRTLRPDIVLASSTNRDGGYLIKQARAMGVKAVFLGGDAWDDTMYSYGGSSITGSHYCNHWHQDSTNSKSREFVKRYGPRFRMNINPGLVLGYDAVMLWADAVRRAKTSGPAEVRGALAATRNFKGVSGNINFDGNRNPVGKAGVVMRFEKGGPVFVKTVEP